MALVHIPKQDREISKPDEIREFLSDYGIQFEQWDVAGRLAEDATDEQILAEYAPEIERLSVFQSLDLRSVLGQDLFVGSVFSQATSDVPLFKLNAVVG